MSLINTLKIKNKNLAIKAFCIFFVALSLIGCSDKNEGRSNDAKYGEKDWPSSTEEFYENELEDLNCDSLDCPEAAAKYVRVTSHTSQSIKYVNCSAVYLGDQKIALNAHCFESESAGCSGNFYFPKIPRKSAAQMVSCEKDFLAYDYRSNQGIDYAVVKIKEKIMRKAVKVYKGNLLDKQSVFYFGKHPDHNTIQKMSCRINFNTYPSASLMSGELAELLIDTCPRQQGHSGGGIYIETGLDEWEVIGIHHSSHSALVTTKSNGDTVETNLVKKFNMPFGYATNINCLNVPGVYDASKCHLVNKSENFEKQFLKLFETSQSVYKNGQQYTFKEYLDNEIDAYYISTGIKFSYSTNMKFNQDSLIGGSFLEVKIDGPLCVDKNFNFTVGTIWNFTLDEGKIMIDTEYYELTEKDDMMRTENFEYQIKDQKTLPSGVSVLILTDRKTRQDLSLEACGT